MISEGAGAEMRRALGTAVFAGLLGVTLFGLFLTPVFYYVIQMFSDWRAERRARFPEEEEEDEEPAREPALAGQGHGDNPGIVAEPHH